MVPPRPMVIASPFWPGRNSKSTRSPAISGPTGVNTTLGEGGGGGGGAGGVVWLKRGGRVREERESWSVQASEWERERKRERAEGREGRRRKGVCSSLFPLRNNRDSSVLFSDIGT